MTVARFRIILYTVAAIASLAGLADATYLTVQALTGETLVCGGSPDCFRVLGSSYARIAGVPVAAFGYSRARTFLILGVGAMFLVTLWLLYVQAFILHAYCRYCLFSAAIIFLLAGVVIAIPPSGESAEPES